MRGGGAEDRGCFPTGRHYPGIAHLLRITAAGLAEEFPPDNWVNELPLVAIDTETTGRDPTSDRIVELACVTFLGGQVVQRKDWLINPGRPIPKEAFDVHGIGDAEVRDAPPFSAIALDFLGAVQGHVPVAYNAEFDRKILSSELARGTELGGALPPALRKGVEWIDPLVWARELHKLEKSRALSDVAERLGIVVSRAHRAADDAETTLKVFNAFLPDPRLPKTYGAFIQEQRRLLRQFDADNKIWRNRGNGAPVTQANEP